MAYVPAGSLCPLWFPPIFEPAPLGTVPGLATAGAVRAWYVHRDGLLQVTAIDTVGNGPPEVAQGEFLVGLRQSFAAVPFHGTPCIVHADNGERA